jgi:hypothetical protein
MRFASILQPPTVLGHLLKLVENCFRLSAVENKQKKMTQRQFPIPQTKLVPQLFYSIRFMTPSLLYLFRLGNLNLFEAATGPNEYSSELT